MLYLIDSSIYVFRAWQTLPASITNTHGEQANAVHGFTATLANILSEKNPDYIVCAFDTSHGSGERNRIYPDYKANRPPAPEELKIQFSRCREVARALGVPEFASESVEADDIIGQLAELARANDLPVTIVSADKDLTQFIRKKDVYWNFAKKEQRSYAQLEKQFKIKPEQVADMLAICGDKVDNVPGVPGVGQTTAARLLKKWHDIDGIIENRDKIAAMQFRGAPRVATLIDEHKETIFLARQLTGLIKDKSLPRSMTKLKRKNLTASTMAKRLQEAGLSESRANNVANMTS